MVFSVQDTGCGISKVLHEDLFNRFRQVNNRVNLMPSNGAGLGLSICKDLTKLMNGEIWFESEPNVGSQFFVRIPMKS
jgi:signal transduction histidine kinase